MLLPSAVAETPTCAPAPLLPPLAPHFVLAAQARVHDIRIPAMAALADTTRRLLHVLLGQCPKHDPARLAPISRERLAEKVGKSVPTVDRGLRELVSAQLIERLPQYGPGERRHGRPHPVVRTRLTDYALQLVGLSELTTDSQLSKKASLSPQGQAVAPVDKTAQEAENALSEATGMPDSLQPRLEPVAARDEAARTPEPLRPLLAVMTGPQVWHLAGLASAAGFLLEDVLKRAQRAVLAARRPFGYLRRLVLCGRTWTSSTLPERQEAAAVKREAVQAHGDARREGFLASQAGQWFVSGGGGAVLQVVGFTVEEHRRGAGGRWGARLLNPAMELERVIDAVEAGQLRPVDGSEARRLLAE